MGMLVLKWGVVMQIVGALLSWGGGTRVHVWKKTGLKSMAKYFTVISGTDYQGRKLRLHDGCTTCTHSACFSHRWFVQTSLHLEHEQICFFWREVFLSYYLANLLLPQQSAKGRVHLAQRKMALWSACCVQETRPWLLKRLSTTLLTMRLAKRLIFQR